MVKVDEVYFQVAHEHAFNFGKYGKVLGAYMVTPDGEGCRPQLCFYVNYLGSEDYDYIPVSEFGIDSNATHWLCSYEQTQS